MIRWLKYGLITGLIFLVATIFFQIIMSWGYLTAYGFKERLAVLSLIYLLSGIVFGSILGLIPKEKPIHFKTLILSIATFILGIPITWVYCSTKYGGSYCDLTYFVYFVPIVLILLITSFIQKIYHSYKHREENKPINWKSVIIFGAIILLGIGFLAFYLFGF